MAKLSLFEAYSGNALQALHSEVGVIAEQLHWVLDRMLDQPGSNVGAGMAFDLMLRLEDALAEVEKWPWPRWRCAGLEASNCTMFEGPGVPPAPVTEFRQACEAG